MVSIRKMDTFDLLPITRKLMEYNPIIVKIPANNAGYGYRDHRYRFGIGNYRGSAVWYAKFYELVIGRCGRFYSRFSGAVAANHGNKITII